MPVDDAGGSTAPEHVERASNEFFGTVGDLLGDRLGELRFDPDRGLRITVIDLDDDDTRAVTDAARSLGITDWVRIDRADPDDLAAWERLRHDLMRIRLGDRDALVMYPSLEPGYRRPPVEIHLGAGALRQAAALHDSYGEFVSLRVGAQRYPPTTTPPPGSERRAPAEERETLDPAEGIVVLESPLTVPSGESTTHAVLLTNRADHDLAVHTTGQLTADIVDDTGAVVGGYVGFQNLPLIVFTATPSATVRIPVLVGTASHTSDFGYAIPPGTWHLTLRLDLADGRRLVTPPLEFTVTA